MITIYDILDKVDKCEICKTISGYEKFGKDSHGSTTTRFMLVSEAPGKTSLDQNRYWVGASGKLLRKAFQNADFVLEEFFYLTDIVKCWPQGNRAPKKQEVINCSQYLEQELDILNPLLILSFGKKSSEALLQQKIFMRDAHGKVFNYNDLTKVLVMYHPSNINLHMRRDLYIKQLEDVFKKLRINDIDGLENIFKYQPNISTQKSDHKISPLKSSSSQEFILPAPGNRITANDVQKNKLRITSDFKKYFPKENTDLTIIHQNIKYKVRFNERGRRSHLLRLGNDLAHKLALKEGDSVKITKWGEKEYEIEKN